MISFKNAVEYNVSTLPLYIKQENILNYPNHATTPHFDSDMETIYIFSGSMYIIINGESILLNEKEVCVIDSGCMHYFTSNQDKECIFYSGLCNESLFSGAQLIQDKYINPIFHSFHPNYAIIRKDNPILPSIIALYSSIKELTIHKNEAYELLLVSKIHEYIALLSLALPDSFFLKNPVSSNDFTSFQKMVHFIYTNYGEKITIDDLSNIGNVSRKHCYKLFYKYASKTPNDFLMDYRLDKAKNLLKQSNISIADIAMSCGFSHQSHFTTHFKKMYGITPNAYRNDSKIFM